MQFNATIQIYIHLN